MNIDWDALQVQYEVFHEPVKTLAEENHVDPVLIEYAVEEKGWKRTPISGVMHKVKDVGDLEEITDDILMAVGDRLAAVNILKAATMNPRYIALETAILAKAREIVMSMMAQGPTAGDQLKKVAEILTSLREYSIPSMAKAKGANEDDGRVVVQIMNTVDLIQSEPEAKPVVEISSSAGAQ